MKSPVVNIYASEKKAYGSNENIFVFLFCDISLENRRKKYKVEMKVNKLNQII